MLMKPTFHPAIHCVGALIFIGLLFAGQGKLAAVLYLMWIAVEIFVSAVRGKHGNDIER
jgi:hypothetical protein